MVRFNTFQARPLASIGGTPPPLNLEGVSSKRVDPFFEARFPRQTALLDALASIRRCAGLYSPVFSGFSPPSKPATFFFSGKPLEKIRWHLV